MPAWSDVRQAIRTWVKSTSGYADGKVIFADQDGMRPTGAFATIRLGQVRAVGIDGVRYSTDLGQPAGQEVEARTEAVRELPVEVQFFGSPPDAATDAARATQAKLALPSVRSALWSAGLAPFDAGEVRNVSAILDAGFESRAVLEVRFYLSGSVSERLGYIASVEVTDEIDPPRPPFQIP